MKYCVFDAETTLRNRGDEAVGKFMASPYHPDNRAVYFGYKGDAHRSVSIVDMRHGTPPEFFSAAKFLVGHNIKFDLAYLRKHWPDDYLAWVRGGGRIWDTMIVEYLLTGQQAKMVSLDKLSEQYGGTLKDERLKEYWDAGVDTMDIPADIVIPYLEQDVLNTEKIFLKQLEQVRALGMVQLVLSQMDAVLCTADMQWNGAHFEKQYALKEARELQDKLDVVVAELTSLANQYAPELTEYSPASPDNNSVVLFGGVILESYDKPIMENGEYVRYKSGTRKGEIKTKKDKRAVPIAGIGAEPKQEWLSSKQGIYRMDDEIVHTILKKAKGDVAKYCTLLLTFRAIQKDLATYFIGYSDLCWHDNKIRSEHNHCVTVTGRLSSSNPNLQNVSNKERD